MGYFVGDTLANRSFITVLSSNSRTTTFSVASSTMSHTTLLFHPVKSS